jgi:hypothetical protein
MAAVYWSLKLGAGYPQPFTLQHWAGVRFYTSSFKLAKSYVFIKQSLPPLLLLFHNPLYPEVTGLICRVPSTLFTLLSWFIQPAYLC